MKQPKLTFNLKFGFVTLNILGTVLAGALLMTQLYFIKDDYLGEKKKVEAARDSIQMEKARQKTAKTDALGKNIAPSTTQKPAAAPGKPANSAAPDTTKKDAGNPPAVNPAPQTARVDTPAMEPVKTGKDTTIGPATSTSGAVKSQEEEKEESTISFFVVIGLMLTAGGLGGLLCNLRGIFSRYRDEINRTFPEELMVPYAVRPFSSAICGVFTYFLAHLLVVSITVDPTVDVPFKGMVSLVGLAILAGFGGQQFMERMKEAPQFFGQRKTALKGRRLKQYKQMLDDNLITQKEYGRFKAILYEYSPEERKTLFAEEDESQKPVDPPPPSLTRHNRHPESL